MPESFSRLPAFVRMRHGAFIALGAFGVFVLVLTIVYFVQGPFGYSRRGMPIRNDRILWLYPLGAMLAGATVGLLQPLAKHKWGAIVLGTLSIAVWSAVIALASGHGPFEWTTEKSVVVVIVSLLIGPPLGATVQWKPRRVRLKHKQRVTSRVHPPAG